MPPHPGGFREVLGNFATSVTVVTLPTDPPHGITANAFASVSLDPPLVLVCIDHDTDSHDLLATETVTGFCVNILAADQLHLGEYYADLIELDADPFDTDPTTTAETGARVFTESLAYVDCTLWASYPGGDHTIYVGHVEAADVLNPDTPALTFFRGGWGELA